MKTVNRESMLGEAKRVFEIEAQCILDLKNKLDERFDLGSGSSGLGARERSL